MQEVEMVLSSGHHGLGRCAVEACRDMRRWHRAQGTGKHRDERLDTGKDSRSELKKGVSI